MTELDTFDARLTRAYRRYLAEAPTSVDAVAMAHTAAGARRPAWRLDWPLVWRPARSLAWLVVLGLLVALAAAALYVGARPPALVGACPQDSQPDAAGPSDQARPPWVYFQPTAFDSKAGLIVAHANDTWTFDVCTNTWTQMHPTVEAPEANNLVYDADSDLFIAIAGSRAWAYDLDANSWIGKDWIPFEDVGRIGNSPRMVYDRSSGLIVVQGEGVTGQAIETWTYDVDSDTWAHIDATGAPENHRRTIMAYDSSINRIVVYDGEWPGTWLLDPVTGQWTRSTDALTPETITPKLGYDWYVSGQEITYDVANAKTVAFSLGRLIAFDAVTSTWDTVLDPPPGDAGLSWIGRPSIVYDSFNRRIVVVGSEYATADSAYRADGVLAFDMATRQWITLLAPTGQKVPN